jgi:hypothetical protein
VNVYSSRASSPSAEGGCTIVACPGVGVRVYDNRFRHMLSPGLSPRVCANPVGTEGVADGKVSGAGYG